MNKLFIHVAIVTLLLLMLPLTQTTTAQSGNNLTKLFGNTTDNYNSQMDAIRKSIDSAQLHSNSTGVNDLNTALYLITCINNVFFQPTLEEGGLGQVAATFCDQRITQNIVDHSYGDNQTLVKLAHAFLTARGIK